MSDSKDVDRVWKLMEKIGVCMMASKDGDKIRSRPMGARPNKAHNVIYFLTDVRGHKDEEIHGDHHVCLSFAEPAEGKFLTISGEARVLNDRELIRELWDTAAEAWWSGPNDPVVRAIRVTPHEAQFWEGPHGIVATFGMAVAAATSAPPLLGEHRKVDLD
ncbi:MAG: pyridoxamine 5'-phosphate oxidase family protein [Hyphomonadaceae bacterium]|nr:pyridoxamine 5'-phosphate oxidase family protein [Hyphomonadaceae bacterium]